MLSDAHAPIKCNALTDMINTPMTINHNLSFPPLSATYPVLYYCLLSYPILSSHLPHSVSNKYSLSHNIIYVLTDTPYFRGIQNGWIQDRDSYRGRRDERVCGSGNGVGESVLILGREDVCTILIDKSHNRKVINFKY